MSLAERLSEIDHKIDTLAKRLGGQPVVYDGAFNAAAYEKSPVRVLAIGKEPYTDCDDYKTARNYEEGTFWNIFQQVCFGALHNTYDVRILPVPERRNDYTEFDHSFAWINMRKISAGSETNSALLKKQYRQEGWNVILREQVQILQPHIIICCGTLGSRSVCDEVWEDIQFLIPEYISKSRSGSIAYFYDKTHIILDCYHPSARGINTVSPLPGLSAHDSYVQYILDALAEWRRGK